MCLFDYLFNVIYPTLDFKICEDGTVSVFSLLYSPAAATGLSTWLGLVDGWMLDELIDRLMDGWMGGWIDDRWMDR